MPRTRTTCGRWMRPATATPAATTRGRTCATWTAATRSWARGSNTIHNLHYYLRLMARIRTAIEDGRFGEFARGFLDGPEGTGVAVGSPPGARV